MKILSFIYRILLSLRYKVEIKGSEVLKNNNSKLILPNHQALIDPQILVAHIFKYSKVVPVVSELYLNIPVLKSFFKMLGAVPVSDLTTENRDNNVLRFISANVAEALQNGKNVLLYPAGQIAGQGYEKIFNKQSAWAIACNMPDNTQIIAVRISGLWGSMWSRAWIGKSPNLIKTFLKAFFYVIANFIFFIPKRNITIEFTDVTNEALKYAKIGKNEFNNFLEKYYNKYGEENVRFMKHFFYSPKLNRKLPERIEWSVTDVLHTSSFDEKEIPEEIFEKIKIILTIELNIDIKKINLHSNLNLELDIDSLGLISIINLIENEFKIKVQVEVINVKTVADLCFIALNKKIDNEILKPSYLSENNSLNESISFNPSETITKLLVKTLKNNKKEYFVYDKMIGSSSRKEFLLKAYVVSKIIKKEIDGKYVGIMLPALQSTTLLVAASYLAGKIPVMLNWTVGPRIMDHCINSINLEKIITAKSFFDKISDSLSNETKQKCIFFEQKVKKLSLKTKISGLLSFYLSVFPKTNPDETAVVLFTSGSESLPKTVELTHENILYDLRGSLDSLSINYENIFLGFLPPFHSFGFTVLTILPLVTSLKIAYTPDPTDSREVLKILKYTKANTLCATPTFIKMILAISYDNDLKDLKLVVSGAESLHSSIIDTFKQKTSQNAKLIEGYGITECSPILTINPLHKQKLNSVGVFINVVESLITDINTYQILPRGKEGMIMVSGKNIFKGYKDKNIDSPFVKINDKEFYKTGDLGYIDDEGYLFITGRLKRFIKIAGEMISLPSIENVLLQKFGNQDSLVLAVEGTDNTEPAQIVLFSIIDIDLTEVNLHLKNSGFSSLIKINKIIKINEIPVLGTGKTDYKVLKNMI